jgi:15-cis-phytoene synthase
VFAGKPMPRVCTVVDQLLADARKHLDAAIDLLADAPRQVRPVFLPLAVARRDLRRLSRPDSDPFAPQAPSRLSTLWTLWRASRSRVFGG